MLDIGAGNLIYGLWGDVTMTEGTHTGVGGGVTPGYLPMRWESRAAGITSGARWTGDVPVFLGVFSRDLNCICDVLVRGSQASRRRWRLRRGGLL